MFASDSMINLRSISRKDDLESIMYLLCFLYKGTLPVLDFINEKVDANGAEKFLPLAKNYRL